MNVNLSYECIERLDQIREIVDQLTGDYPDLSNLIEAIVFSVDLVQFRSSIKKVVSK